MRASRTDARSAQRQDAERPGNPELPPAGFAAAFDSVNQEYLDAERERQSDGVTFTWIENVECGIGPSTLGALEN